MSSVSPDQAHLMAAVDHGWQPPGKHIDRAMAHEWHTADKKVGKWEHFKQTSDHENMRHGEGHFGPTQAPK